MRRWALLVSVLPVCCVVQDSLCILITVSVKCSTCFGVSILCDNELRCRRFGINCCLHLQDWSEQRNCVGYINRQSVELPAGAQGARVVPQLSLVSRAN